MLTLEQAIKKYGPICYGTWANESLFCESLKLPDDIAAQMVNSATGGPTHHIYCNKDMSPILLDALYRVRSANLLHEIHSFDGCFMIRDIRGNPGQISTHAYALAIDLNAKTNALGAEPSFSPEFVSCFVDAGFIWGGTFARRDGMHFQAALW